MTGRLIYFAERNIRGAWVVYGLCGVKQYYGYTRKEAIARYRSECDNITHQGRKTNG